MFLLNTLMAERRDARGAIQAVRSPYLNLNSRGAYAGLGLCSVCLRHPTHWSTGAAARCASEVLCPAGDSCNVGALPRFAAGSPSTVVCTMLLEAAQHNRLYGHQATHTQRGQVASGCEVPAPPTGGAYSDGSGAFSDILTRTRDVGDGDNVGAGPTVTGSQGRPRSAAAVPAAAGAPAGGAWRLLSCPRGGVAAPRGASAPPSWWVGPGRPSASPGC